MNPTISTENRGFLNPVNRPQKADAPKKKVHPVTIIMLVALAAITVPRVNDHLVNRMESYVGTFAAKFSVLLLQGSLSVATVPTFLARLFETLFDTPNPSSAAYRVGNIDPFAPPMTASPVPKRAIHGSKTMKARAADEKFKNNLSEPLERKASKKNLRVSFSAETKKDPSSL